MSGGLLSVLNLFMDIYIFMYAFIFILILNIYINYILLCDILKYRCLLLSEFYLLSVMCKLITLFNSFLRVCLSVAEIMTGVTDYTCHNFSPRPNRLGENASCKALVMNNT